MAENLFGRIKVRIKGRTPLLMNRLDIQDLMDSGIRRKTRKWSPEKDAEKSAYIDVIDGKRQLYIPCEAVYSMLINTAKAFREKKTSMSSILAGAIQIIPEKIPLGTDKYEVDIRPVVIQKNRVPKARARLDKWEATFYIIYYKPRFSDPTILKTILEDGGYRMGLLDYRPQHKGWFGTFTVEDFEILE